MFASQLLRILQTIPSDMKHETCVLDSSAQNMNMKKNQDLTFYDSKSFGKDADSLAFGGEGICQLNGSRRGIAFEVNGRDERWNSKIMDDMTDDNESRTIDSSRKEDPNELSHLRGQERDAESLPSGTKDEEKLHGSPVLVSTGVDEIVHHRESESRDSGSILISTSDLFETDTDLYTDKNVLECEMPELIVCYKEINYHIVKDICVDEGMPAKDKVVIESSKDDHSDVSLAQPPHVNYNCDDTEVVANNEFVMSDGLAEAALENTKSVGENDCGNIEVSSDDKILAQFKSRFPSESSFENDTAKHCDLEDSIPTGEANCGATGRIVADISEKESFIESKLPIQEFGTRSFLRSFLNTLDVEGNKDVQPLDQIISGTEPKDHQPTNMLYNSKVESGSITFNFNHPAPAVSSITNGGVENAADESSESQNVHNRWDKNADSSSDSRSIQCSGIKDSSTGDVQERSLDIKKLESDHSSDSSQVQFASSSQVQFASSKDMKNKTSDTESFEHEDNNSNDHSTSGVVQFVSSKSQSSIKDDTQAVEPRVMKHGHKNSDDASVVSPLQYDEGDSSFSAAGLVTFSGPIAYSGSLSLRSDGSATSGRSFAFPVLQSEWNSSPVRMAKADRRHFRKHKGWRSGLLCCRF